MIYRKADGSLINISAINYTNDKSYYSHLIKIMLEYDETNAFTYNSLSKDSKYTQDFLKQFSKNSDN